MIYVLIILLFITTGIYLLVKAHKRQRKSIVGIVLVTLGVLISLPAAIPYGLVGFHTVRCGHLPVVGSSFAAGYDYAAPGNKNYTDEIGIFTNGFFCSEEEARNAGYHSRPSY